MKTLLQHERDFLEAARQRAHENNLREIREERRQLTELQLSVARNKVSNLEREAKALGDAQKLPTFELLLNAMRHEMAHFLEPHLRKEALRVAGHLIEGAEVALFPVHLDNSEQSMTYEFELVVAFMKPKDYHLRRSLPRPR